MKKGTEKANKKNQKFGQIMGIRVLSTMPSSVLTGVESLISDNTKFFILTPNSELVLMAQDNKKLKEALNSADLPVPDTVGLKYAYKYLYGKSLNIIPGRKLFVDLVDLANRKGWKVFLLGGLDNEAELAAERLKDVTFRDTDLRLKIQAFRGPKLNENAGPVTEVDEKLEEDAIDRINKFAPQLLFVAFGNPKQEIWVHEHYSKLNIGGAMAVGGAFRYLAGRAKLPPEWMAGLGLEWLWRGLTEPARIGRIWNAVVIFPVKLFLYNISR